ncbi:unnamed protein product [Prorocentrum cordatum]|uniref:Uncharacterized protein n=1 Tax=Prorocentrum cordatum TaxID=2364126 RepID=A0ABN9P9T6_9DINO|nr:unnamed protein product [Polarella glacialis]
MQPAARDRKGFRHWCNRAQVGWLLVKAVKQFVDTGGPFPRRQDIPSGSLLIGAPPRGRRLFVVSHGWETEVHPSPGGHKMRQLAAALARNAAADDDLVFFDFCSNPQEAKMGSVFMPQHVPWEGAPARSCAADAYFEQHGLTRPLKGRSPEEKRAFGVAMFEMSRLYCYRDCEVIVLPELHGPDEHPGGKVWGVINEVPYENRGWCCAEFSIALYSTSHQPAARIINLGDPSVQRVLTQSRKWPTNVTEYAEMMKYTLNSPTSAEQAEGLKQDKSLGVNFTAKGDRSFVKYNFFKFTMGPHENLLRE